MRRAILIISVLAVGLAIGGYVFFNGERKAPVRYRSAAVERGPVDFARDCDGNDQSCRLGSGWDAGVRHDQEPACRFQFGGQSRRYCGRDRSRALSKLVAIKLPAILKCRKRMSQEPEPIWLNASVNWIG